MTFWIGLILVAVTVGMVTMARPADGVAAPFLKVWLVAQAYILTALASMVVGVSIMISNRPF